ncbi:MAG: carbohydrate porin [Rhodomicrobium sp.]
MGIDKFLRSLRGSGALLACVAAALFALTASSPALAAGPPEEAAAGYDWSGAYIGGHFGYSFGHTSDTLSDPAPMAASDGFGSAFGGLQIGYNYLMPSRFLLGVESDIAFANFLEDGQIAARQTPPGGVTDKIDYIGTLRGRFGYAIDPWLIYATGGLAWSGARFAENDVDKVLPMHVGFALGAGVEIPISPKWTARLEYLYDRLGNAEATFQSGTHYQSEFDINTVRLGLNYQLNGPDGNAPASKAGEPWPIASDAWNVHGQLTFVGQGYGAFRSPYEGAQSLSGDSQFKNTTSATAFIGVRPWNGTEIYVNPEIIQGDGLSYTYGIADFPNGEAQKSGFPMPRVNIARVYLQQTFGLGGEQETVEDGANQLAGSRDVSRITVTAGKFSVIDFFDNNSFSHDPRKDFMSWNMYCCGSYDQTMDKISYDWGAIAELNQKSWAFRAGYFLVPTVSNVNTFDMDIPDHGEYIGEFEWRYSLLSEPGKLRFMGWLNRAVAGSYEDALALPLNSPNYPDITLTRKLRDNYGFVVNAEQAITGDLGLFSRVSWDAGQTEKIGWTDCDQSLSLGAVLKGTSWGRPDDKIGIGGVIEGLSPEAQAYFEAGGLGILIGDGALNYKPEMVLETYYALSLTKATTVTFDYQFVDNPAYNADRGPVSIFAGRLHMEF